MAERQERIVEAAGDAIHARLSACRDDVDATAQVKDPCAAAAALTVLYDGSCPLCRREIGLYSGLNAEQPLRFEDVSDVAVRVTEGVTRAQLMARFHVRQPDGSLLSGAQAFIELWAVLPGWRWLSRLGRLPGAAWVMEQAYRGFLHLRPTLQRWAARLDRPPVDGSTGS